MGLLGLRHCLFRTTCPKCGDTQRFFDTISCTPAQYLTAERTSTHPKRCHECGFHGSVADFPVVFVSEHTWAEARAILMEKPAHTEAQK